MPVFRERRGNVLVIRLDRETKRNAIDPEMTAGIDAALSELDDDPDLMIGVLYGGSRVFSAGTDLAVTDHASNRTERGGEYGIVRRRRRKPLVAAVEGPALGGGLEIVLACDLVVAAESATFGLPEVRLGVVAACGGLFRAHRALPRNVANELLLVGAPLSARRARELGLVNRLTPDGGALHAALQLAAQVAANAPVAVMETLRAVRDMDDDARDWRVSDRAVSVVVASADAAEGRAAFFERRAPEWSGD